MEEGVNNDMAGWLYSRLSVPAADYRTFSPLVLAYIGDDIFDLIIRTRILAGGNRPVNEMNQQAARIVRASTQAQMYAAVEPMLTEEEKDIVRRGRNAHPASTAKNASVADYHTATGFEALAGWLYLAGDMNRLTEIVSAGLSALKIRPAGGRRVPAGQQNAE